MCRCARLFIFNAIVTLFASTMSFAASLTHAHACSCAISVTDRPQLFSNAQAIFIAEVTDTKLVKTVHKEHDLEYIIADIKILETFKNDSENSNGNNAAPTQVIDLVPESGNCSIALISGLEYVFFVDGHHNEDEETEKGSIKQDNYVGRCTGSHIINIYSVHFEEEHEELRKLAKQHKEEEKRLSQYETNNETNNEKADKPENSFKLNE